MGENSVSDNQRRCDLSSLSLYASEPQLKSIPVLWSFCGTWAPEGGGYFPGLSPSESLSGIGLMLTSRLLQPQALSPSSKQERGHRIVDKKQSLHVTVMDILFRDVSQTGIQQVPCKCQWRPMVRLSPGCKAFVEVSGPPEPFRQWVCRLSAKRSRGCRASPLALLFTCNFLPFFNFLFPGADVTNDKSAGHRDGGMGSFSSPDGPRHPGILGLLSRYFSAYWLCLPRGHWLLDLGLLNPERSHLHTPT